MRQQHENILMRHRVTQVHNLKLDMNKKKTLTTNKCVMHSDSVTLFNKVSIY